MLQYADRVQETTPTTGTGPYALDGAVTGYQAFGSICANDDTCFYCATDGINWEVGLGTYATSGNSLARTTILASSNGGSAVSWATAIKNIWLDVPANYFTANAQTRQVTTPGTITQLASDKVIVVQNNSGGAVSVDLMPAADMPPNGDITVVDGLGYNSVGPITLTPSGSDTINGASSLTFEYDYQYQKLTPVAGGYVVTG